MITPPTTSELFDYGTKIIAVCSVLHSALPPVAEFDDYPRAQKAYKLFVNLVGYVAVNWRGAVQNNASVTTNRTASVNAVPTTETTNANAKGA